MSGVETTSYSFNGDNVAGRAVFDSNQPPLHPSPPQGQGGGSGSLGRAPRRTSTARRSSAPRRTSRTTRRSSAPRRASRTARRTSPARRSSAPRRTSRTARRTSPARRSSAPRRTSTARRSSAPRRTSTARRSSAPRRTARSLSRARRSSAPRRTSPARRSSALKKRISKRVKPRPRRGVAAKKKGPVSPDSNVSSRTLSLTEGSSDERVKKAPVKTPLPNDTGETLTLPRNTSSGRGGLSGNAPARQGSKTRSQAYYLKFYSDHKTTRLRNALKNASGVEAKTLEILIQNREDMAKNAGGVDLFDGSALSDYH